MAAALIALSTQIATIAVTSTNKDLILRSGPGYHHPVKAIIKNSKDIKISLCNPTWCYVHNGKVRGWVKTNTIIADSKTFTYPQKNAGEISSTGGSRVANGAKNGGGSLAIRLKIIPPAKTGK